MGTGVIIPLGAQKQRFPSPSPPQKRRRRRERRPFFSFPSLQLSPRSFLAGREGRTPQCFHAEQYWRLACRKAVARFATVRAAAACVGTCAVKRTLLRGAVRSDAQFTSAAARSNMRTNQQPAGIELKLAWPMVKA